MTGERKGSEETLRGCEMALWRRLPGSKRKARGEEQPDKAAKGEVDEIVRSDRAREEIFYVALLVLLILAVAVVIYAFNLERLNALFSSEYFNNFTRIALALLIVSFVLYLIRREKEYSRQSKGVFEELRSTTDGLRRQLEDLTNLLEVSKLVAIADDLHARLEKKMPHMKGHWKRVAFYAVEIARKMDLDEDYVRLIDRAANLMDIGMLRLAGSISDASNAGALVPADKELIKMHPKLGAEMLSAIRPNWELIPLVRSHHEWWNGMGYPDGLKGEAIPLGARILSVADAFVAMTSWRAYREIMEVKEAVKEINAYSGVQFDPKVVKAFLAVMTPRIYGMESRDGIAEELQMLREINAARTDSGRRHQPL